MKPGPMDNKKNGHQSDDDNVRYKINTNYLNKTMKSPNKKVNYDDDDNIRYKLPPKFPKVKSPEQKPKPKSKMKVNFWSNKQSSRLNNIEVNKSKSTRRHTVGVLNQDPPDAKQRTAAVKVRKRVSFLPSPLFSENHIPMVAVPDDLTIQLNEEEANDLGADLNEAFVNSNSDKSNETPKRKSRISMNPESPKRNRCAESLDNRGHNSENELEFFSKYVVQKLRRMETNQRIYSENLINTVLMLGQLGKLNSKSKVNDA